jgi:hypothetical protein
MNYIYKNDGVEAMHMLRMKRAPFNSLVNTFRVRGCLKIASTVVSKSKWQCFFIFLDITSDSQHMEEIY